MRKIALFILLFLFGLVAFSCFAQEGQEEEEVIPPGMEVLQEGRIKVLAPKDAKKRKEGILTVVETTEAYASRKVLDLEESIAQLQADTEALRNELEQLQEDLHRLENRVFSLESR